MNKIRKIDLSSNLISKKGGLQIAKLLKDSVTHIEWIEYYYYYYYIYIYIIVCLETAFQVMFKLQKN